MKTRNLRIGIAPQEAIRRRMLAIAKGEYRVTSEDPRVWFTSAEAMARVFSKTNMLLIEIIRNHEPDSVTELAELAHKQKTNVLRSLKLLREYDIVEFDEGAGNRKAPRVKYDDFNVTVKLGGWTGKAA